MMKEAEPYPTHLVISRGLAGFVALILIFALLISVLELGFSAGDDTLFRILNIFLVIGTLFFSIRLSFTGKNQKLWIILIILTSAFYLSEDLYKVKKAKQYCEELTDECLQKEGGGLECPAHVSSGTVSYCDMVRKYY